MGVCTTVLEPDAPHAAYDRKYITMIPMKKITHPTIPSAPQAISVIPVDPGPSRYISAAFFLAFNPFMR
jgi:hypothetical protein